MIESFKSPESPINPVYNFKASKQIYCLIVIQKWELMLEFSLTSFVHLMKHINNEKEK